MINFDRINKSIRIKIKNKPGVFGKIADVIGANNGNMGDIKVQRKSQKYIIRDVKINAETPNKMKNIIDELRKVNDMKIIKVFSDISKAHEGGMLETKSKVKIESKEDLDKYFLPGISKIAKTIDRNYKKVYEYTNIGNTVGIFSTGESLLDFNICNAEATYSVMESYAAVLNEFVGVSAMPMVLDSKDEDTVIKTIDTMHKNFGMVILEDIHTETVKKLEKRLHGRPTPILDTNKYGNAIATLAGLISIFKDSDKKLSESTVGFLGFGSKALGTTQLMQAYGIKKIYANDIKEEGKTRMKEAGVMDIDTAKELMDRSDIVIGTSRKPNIIKFGMVKKDQIILALSKPIPEIKPEVAKKAGAKYAGDGGLITPLLVVPGLIRGALDARASKISIEMMLAAAEKLSDITPKGEMLPEIFQKDLHKEIANTVKQAAKDEGVDNLLEEEVDEENENKEKAEDIFENIKDVNMWMPN
ncbi:MAG: ACT domain-containing protein [Fusobacteriota bacterium]